MRIHRTLSPVAVAALAVGLLASGPGVAQTSSSDASHIGDPSAPLGSPANPIKQSSPTPSRSSARRSVELQRPFPVDDLGPIDPFLIGVVAAIDLLVHQRFTGV